MIEIFVDDVMGRNYDVITFVSKYHFFRRPSVANFAEIIKIAVMFFKTTFKDPEKVKKIRNYVLKCMISITVFLDITKVADFQRKNAAFSKTQGVCHVVYIIHVKFQHFKICVTDFR